MRSDLISWTASALVAVLILGAPTAAAAQAARATAEIPADKAKVVGSIAIDYNTRSERSQSNVDVYTVQDLAIADLMIMKGEIQRVPEQRMVYSVRFDVINPQNPAQIARDAAILRGEMSIDANGRYNPEDGQLRIDIIKGNQNTSRFTGGIQGRAVTRWWQIGKKISKVTEEATKAYSRMVDGKVVSIAVKILIRCVSSRSASPPDRLPSSSARRSRAFSTTITNSAIG